MTSVPAPWHSFNQAARPWELSPERRALFGLCQWTGPFFEFAKNYFSSDLHCSPQDTSFHFKLTVKSLLLYLSLMKHLKLEIHIPIWALNWPGHEFFCGPEQLSANTHVNWLQLGLPYLPLDCAKQKEREKVVFSQEVGTEFHKTTPTGFWACSQNLKWNFSKPQLCTHLPHFLFEHCHEYCFLPIALALPRGDSGCHFSFAEFFTHGTKSARPETFLVL